jgi:hypothetical protein
MTSNIATDCHFLFSLVRDRLPDHDLVLSDDGWSCDDRTIGASLSLFTLAQTLAGVEKEEWPSRVDEWLGLLLNVDPTIKPRLDEALPRLRIRLNPPDDLPEWAVHRPICDGLSEMLMLKNDVGAQTINQDDVSAWGVDHETLWAQARQQTVWDEPRERRILARGRARIVWVRDSFFASSLLVSLDHLLSPRNRHGAVAMVPVRDALLYTEILNRDVVESTAGMMEVGCRWYVEGPGAVSADLFWYRPGAGITRIARVVRSGPGGFEPTWNEDFSRVLAELERAGARTGD